MPAVTIWRALPFLLLGLALTPDLPATLANHEEQALAALEAQVLAMPQAAIDTARELLKDPTTPEFAARLHALIADAQLQQGDFTSADETARTAIEALRDDIPPSLHAELLGLRAALPWREGRLTDALGIMLQAYRLAADGREAATTARCANRLGILYSNLGRPDEALRYYHIALELDRTGDAPPAKLASTLGNLGLLYHLLNNYEEAAGYQAEAVALYEEAADPYGTARNQTNLAITRSKIDQPEDAIVLIDRSLATQRELGDPRGLTSALLARATIHNTLGHPAESLHNIAEALPLLRAQNAQGELAEALTIQARALPPSRPARRGPQRGAGSRRARRTRRHDQRPRQHSPPPRPYPRSSW